MTSSGILRDSTGLKTPVPLGSSLQAANSALSQDASLLSDQSSNAPVVGLVTVQIVVAASDPASQLLGAAVGWSGNGSYTAKISDGPSITLSKFRGFVVTGTPSTSHCTNLCPATCGTGRLALTCVPSFIQHPAVTVRSGSSHGNADISSCVSPAGLASTVSR